jgi:hypothetical protein
VLVSGVSAAFSIKLTLTPARLQEAIKSASLLRRGMIHPRNEPIGDLVSPLIVGVLALSHSGFGRNPAEKIEKILLDAAADLRPPDMVPGASTSGLASHPRNELDFVCVADLDCWHRHPRVFRQPADGGTTPDLQYAATWSSIAWLYQSQFSSTSYGESSRTGIRRSGRSPTASNGRVHPVSGKGAAPRNR